jgi:hypothetical protein
MFELNASTGWNLSRKLRFDVYYLFTKRSGGGNEISTVATPLGFTTATNYYENQVGINFSYAF